MQGMIGMFVNSLDGYQGCIISEVRDAAAREGLEVEVFDAHHNALQQAEHLTRFGNDNRAKKLCAFLIPEADTVRAGHSDPLSHLATRLVQKNIGLLALNHGREDLIASLRAKHPTLPIALIAIDNVEFGRVQARQLRMLVPGGGTVLCVGGNPLDSACRDRTTGLKEELQRVGAITIEEITAHWDADFAGPHVHKWITSPLRSQTDLRAVICQNDHMGQAAKKALMRAASEMNRPELRQVPVLGGDGLPEYGLRWVADGTLTATVAVTLPGKPAVQQIARYWRSGAPLPAVTKLPVRSHPDISSLRPASA